MPFDGTDFFAKPGLLERLHKKIKLFQPAPDIECVEVLRRAERLIENPINWCQGTYKFRDGGGWYRYCAVGAVRQAALEMNVSNQIKMLAENHLQKTAFRMGFLDAQSLNDYSSHERVLKMIRKSVRNARKDWWLGASKHFF